MNNPCELDRNAVRRQFERRAGRIEQADYLLREIERRMLERLDLVKFAPERLLDVGCGRGQGLLALKKRYPTATALGIDHAGPLIAAARHRGRAPWHGFLSRLSSRAPALAHWAVGDAAALPLAADSADLLWSNLMLHWSPDPRRVLAEWHRVLRPDGLLMFSMFGVDTLRELTQMGAKLMRFHDMHDVGDWLLEAGFAEPVMDMERVEISFANADKLLAEIHALGGDARTGRSSGLTGRSTRAHWLSQLEARIAADGRIRVGFEIVYGHAWRVASKPRGDGYVPIDFMPRRIG